MVCSVEGKAVQKLWCSFSATEFQISPPASREQYVIALILDSQNTHERDEDFRNHSVNENILGALNVLNCPSWPVRSRHFWDKSRSRQGGIQRNNYLEARTVQLTRLVLFSSSATVQNCPPTATLPPISASPPTNDLMQAVPDNPSRLSIQFEPLQPDHRRTPIPGLIPGPPGIFFIKNADRTPWL